MARSDYDLPDELTRGPNSQAFSRFLYYWFEDAWPLTRREVSLAFLADLTPSERERARSLLRRNLAVNQTHIIEGLAELGDKSSVPELRAMFSRERDLSRRLTLAGALWKLARDSVFVECLRQLQASDNATLKQAHLDQFLWLGDERSLDALIDLLDDADALVRRLALLHLNQIELGPHRAEPGRAPPIEADDYRQRRSDASFRRMMVDRLRPLRR
jgi:hypothetical protein